MEETWADFCRSRARCASNTARCRRDGAVRFFAEQVVPIDGVPGYRRNDQRFHGSGHRPRRFAQSGNPVPQHLRSGADRHRLCGSRRQIPALQRGVLHPARLQSVRIRGQVDRRADARRRCRERCSAARSPVERRDPVRRHREALPAQGRQLPVGPHEHRPGSRRQQHQCSVEYLRDITHRKELAAALLQQQTLLEVVHHAICRWLCWSATSRGISPTTTAPRSELYLHCEARRPPNRRTLIRWRRTFISWTGSPRSKGRTGRWRAHCAARRSATSN